jgi:hypothetical protein
MRCYRAEDGMSKVLSTLDYWEEFFKKYPDKEPTVSV